MAHSMHTIHTPFTARQMDEPQLRFPPGLEYERSFSHTRPHYVTPSPPNVNSRKRPALRLPYDNYSKYRKALPSRPFQYAFNLVQPSPRNGRIEDEKLTDPFADPLFEEFTYPVIINIPPAYIPQPIARPKPQTPTPRHSANYTALSQNIPNKDVRAKLVASILLNRIYVVGKPMRRWPGIDGKGKVYVKSCLSQGRVIGMEG